MTREFVKFKFLGFGTRYWHVNKCMYAMCGYKRAGAEINTIQDKKIQGR